MFLRYKQPRDVRPGLSLLEMLLALSVLAMMMVALAGLSKAVQLNAAYGDGCGEAVQHARVAIDRITRTVREATANASFPGFIVLTDVDDGWRLPDTLVVWHPNGSPTDPTGLPRFDELVIYGPDPDDPRRLVEITAPGDTRTVPDPSNLATWATEIDAIKAASSSEVVPLTDRMRAGTIGTNSHGAVRFESRLRPSEAEWTEYKDGDLTWDELPWVQGRVGAQTGLRQAWLRIELQLLPEANSTADDQQAIPFFGSAALYYPIQP